MRNERKQPLARKVAMLLGAGAAGTLNACKSRNLVGIAMLVGLIIGAPVTGKSALVTNWKILSNNGNPGSNLNTSSPIIGDGSFESVDRASFAGKFSSAVSLAVGETVTVSGNVLFTGGLNPVADNLAYRVGIFDDGGQFDAGTSGNWTSGWLYVMGGGTGNGNADIYQGRTDGAYGSTFGNSVDLNAAKTSTGDFLANSTALFSWSVAVTRPNATTVDITGKMSGGDGNLDQTYSLQGVGTSAFDFTAVGWQITSVADLGQASFSNVDVSVVPEPGSLMLVTLGFAGMALRQRNRKAPGA